MVSSTSFRPGSIVTTEQFRSVHRDYQKGIYVPAGEDTAVSIRFHIRPNEDYGYSDRWVRPERELDYTGQGAAPQDQSWNRFNLGLRNAQEKGSGVHVFELLEGSPRAFRYHGLWRVTRHYETSEPVQGRKLLRFVLVHGESGLS